jgi:hypothetical protein
MMFRDSIHVRDAGRLSLLDRVGKVLGVRHWEDEKSVFQVEGWVDMVMRERGKIVPGSRRQGKNIWTNTGREYLALHMSYSAPSTPFRTDNIAYVGLGSGSQIEQVGVLALVTPIAYQTGQFLAALDIPPTFPLTPARTTVQYHKTFAETDITISPGTIFVSEIGLFTDGSPLSNYSPGTRDTTLANAASQAPNGYKTFEPVGKTQGLELDVFYQVRF